MVRGLLFFSFLFIISQVQAQQFQISGFVKDSTNQSSLTGVNVVLTTTSDPQFQKIQTTDVDGKFTFASLPPNIYSLTASFIGYNKLKLMVEVKNKSVELGNLQIGETAEFLEAVEIVGKAPTVSQKGDTLQFNANAYKTNPDASTEDLLKKMPGIVVENGNVKAQGEDVKSVLVDGKPFFGDDPTLAIRSLPAEVVDKIEVYDKKSDQAEFTGFDDGDAQKTINIVTKQDRRHGQFGKVYAGVGTSDRYSAGGNINFFNGQQRISIIGLSNNINQQNFSMQDLLGVMESGGRGGGGSGGGSRGGGRSRGGSGGSMGDFLVGQQNGITGTNSFGVNYSDSWGKKINVSGSYFFNSSNTSNNGATNREYFLSEDSSQFYQEVSNTESKDFNHRVNFRINYQIDSANSILIRPRLNFQNNKSVAYSMGENSLSNEELLNRSVSNNLTESDGYNLSNDLLYRHRFGKEGRTFSLNIGTELNKNNRDGLLQAQNNYYDQSFTKSDTINQQSDAVTDGYTLSGRVEYTEPVGKNAQLSVNYETSFTKNNTDKRTFNFSDIEQEYYNLDTTLSNLFENQYITNDVGLGYHFRTEKFSFMTNLSYQIAELKSEQQFPQNDTIDKTFSTFLPMAMLNFRFSRTNNLRFFYRTSLDAPSISQLQNVIDNSNPLFLTTGNPNLRPAYTHMIMGRYSLSNPEKSRNTFLFLMGRITENYIGSTSIIADRNIELADGVVLSKGAQLTMPQNLGTNVNLSANVNYGLPLEKLKSNLNFNTGLSYTRSPGLINQEQNLSNSYNVSQGVVVSSNISKNVDFTLSYNANYNIVKNTIQSQSDNNYFYQTTNFTSKWIFWKGMVLNNDITHQLYSGLTDGFNQNYFLWNVGLGKKLFKKQTGEITLSVFDLLNQNNNISRTVTETYVQDTESLVLRRYFMLTFTFNLRNFNGAGKAPEEGPRFGPRRGFPPPRF